MPLALSAAITAFICSAFCERAADAVLACVVTPALNTARSGVRVDLPSALRVRTALPGATTGAEDMLCAMAGEAAPAAASAAAIRSEVEVVVIGLSP